MRVRAHVGKVPSFKPGVGQENGEREKKAWNASRAVRNSATSASLVPSLTVL